MDIDEITEESLVNLRLKADVQAVALEHGLSDEGTREEVANRILDYVEAYDAEKAKIETAEAEPETGEASKVEAPRAQDSSRERQSRFVGGGLADKSHIIRQR